ncbi:MAG: hypothetical protein HYR98_04180 [Nitrospirae bacterium]|nr:hypothetical protein [Nitrospirota bacterium]
MEMYPVARIDLTIPPPRWLRWLALACIVSVAACSKPSPTNSTADVKIYVRNVSAIGTIYFAANDVFEVSVDGESQGRTPRGGTKTFYLSLSQGEHVLRLAFVDRTDNEAAYSVSIEGAAFDNGGQNWEFFIGGNPHPTWYHEKKFQVP